MPRKNRGPDTRSEKETRDRRRHRHQPRWRTPDRTCENPYGPRLYRKHWNSFSAKKERTDTIGIADRPRDPRRLEIFSTVAAPAPPAGRSIADGDGFFRRTLPEKSRQGKKPDLVHAQQDRSRDRL